jgi:hypothetical protein
VGQGQYVAVVLLWVRFAAELENAVPAKRRDLDAASMFDVGSFVEKIGIQ